MFGVRWRAVDGGRKGEDSLVREIFWRGVLGSSEVEGSVVPWVSRRRVSYGEG